MTMTVCMLARTLNTPTDGGHTWVYINWAMGLQSLGSRVVWLEVVSPTQDSLCVQQRMVAMKRRLAPFGLAGAVWTRDLRRAMLMTAKLKAGTVWVNNYRATSFTSPFGGYKESGIGRESGTQAIMEYLHTKCVWISSDLEVPNPFVRR